MSLATATRRLCRTALWTTCCAGLAMIAGCRSMTNWAPSADLSAFDTLIVQDLVHAEAALGSDFADQLAEAFAASGIFEAVIRTETAARALTLSGTIETYDPGNVAARLKFGRGAGEGRLVMNIRMSDSATDEQLGELHVDERTLYIGPDARRTGREGGDWLQDQAINSILQAVQNRKTKR